MEYYNFFYFKTAELVGKYLTTIFMEHPNITYNKIVIV